MQISPKSPELCQCKNVLKFKARYNLEIDSIIKGESKHNISVDCAIFGTFLC